MKTLAITEFKVHALQILSEIARTRNPVVVTKRGKPVAEVIPFSPSKPVAGRLADTLVFEEDIVSPLGEDMWDAAK